MTRSCWVSRAPLSRSSREPSSLRYPLLHRHDFLSDIVLTDSTGDLFSLLFTGTHVFDPEHGDLAPLGLPRALPSERVRRLLALLRLHQPR